MKQMKQITETNINNKGGNNMIEKLSEKLSEFKNVARTLCCSTAAFLMCAPAQVFAANEQTFNNDNAVIKNTFISNLRSKFIEIRTDLIAISSVVAAVAAAICLLILMFTKNERMTQASYEWLKRIAIAYVAIISLTGILTFLDGLQANGNS